jgi:hypothetical protein
MDPDDYVEVFQTDSTIAAQKVLDVLLVPEGIKAVLRDRKSENFPGAGLPGSLFIAVHRDDLERATGILDEARENGFLEVDEGAPV